MSDLNDTYGHSSSQSDNGIRDRTKLLAIGVAVLTIVVVGTVAMPGAFETLDASPPDADALTGDTENESALTESTAESEGTISVGASVTEHNLPPNASVEVYLYRMTNTDEVTVTVNGERSEKQYLDSVGDSVVVSGLSNGDTIHITAAQNNKTKTVQTVTIGE